MASAAYAAPAPRPTMRNSRWSLIAVSGPVSTEQPGDVDVVVRARPDRAVVLDLEEQQAGAARRVAGEDRAVAADRRPGIAGEVLRRPQRTGDRGPVDRAVDRRHDLGQVDEVGEADDGVARDEVIVSGVAHDRAVLLELGLLGRGRRLEVTRVPVVGVG